jgi:serine/threonine protein kinase
MIVLQANAEPLPGYRLLEPLGKGGFGEVWKCEAPGGLVKAIKFVAGHSCEIGDDGNGADQEFRALQHIKSIRHPYLLSMDRIEVVDGDLLIVMELADSSLHDLQVEYRHKGNPGIPRDELLGYLREAAEILDLMNQQHQLQHLDVKPRNLFLVSRHLKLADFGLVNSVAERSGDKPAEPQHNSITPAYASPESFHGKISQASDQYSLAVAYHEMLTGKMIFKGRNFAQLALQHFQAVPDLSALPESDRAAVARALAKEPTDRFPSCTAFVQALTLGLTDAAKQPTAPAQKQETESNIRLGETNMPAPTATIRRPVPPTTSTPIVKLAGFRLLKCLSREGGELWRGLAPDGGKRLIRFLIAADGEPLTRLAQFKHGCLAKVEVSREGPNRIVLATEAGEENLISRLKECTQEGMTGLPRTELLDLLADVAAALDDLSENHGAHHLTLSPRTVALVGGKARLLDFGLAELFWLQAGQQPGQLNARYAAPELFNGVITRCADQYSLALIFHEMMTGAHAFRNLNARQLASARPRGAPDLGLLPAADRDIVLRALEHNPTQRFPSASDFIEALTDASEKPPAPAPTLRSLTPTPVPSMRAVNELVALASEGLEVRQGLGIRYLLEPGRSIVYHCCASLIRGMLRLKLSNFRDQWKAQSVEPKLEERLVFHVPLPGTLWQRTRGRRPRLAVEVCCTFPTDEGVKLTDVSIRISPEDCNKEQAFNLLDDLGPSLLESLSVCLNVERDLRGQVRFPYARPVKVAPMIGAQLGEPIESMTGDVSRSGLRVIMPCTLPAAQVCVLVALPSYPDPAPIDARVVRVRRRKDGNVEVGLTFA